MTLPRISIVTPSYMQGQFLEWTLRSVLFQGYPNLEYMVFDDNSADHTRDVLERYRPHLSHLECGPKRGQASAVARGLARSTGDILSFLNSDDVLAPGALHFVADYFDNHPSVDVLYSHRVVLSRDNTVTGYWVLPPHVDFLMRRWDWIPQETCFWRRSIYDAAGGIDPSLDFALDYDLFVRFMQRGRMRRVNRFLGGFRKHPDSKTSQLQPGLVHPEVAAVRKRYGIRVPHSFWIIERALDSWVKDRSLRFAQGGASMPGALPGIGYDYDRVWNGVLNHQDLPALL